jgi:hypothetical protein
MKAIKSLLGVLSLVTTSAYGWGVTGHQAVGYVLLNGMNTTMLR